MTQMNRTVRAALVIVATLTGGLVTLASAQTATSMPMKSTTSSMPMKMISSMPMKSTVSMPMRMPTKAQCMTARYKNTAACKKMMMTK